MAINIQGALARCTMPLLAALLACLVQPATATAQEDDPLTYEVQAGDTLYSLNQRYMRGSGAIAAVALLNRIYNPRRIPVGQVLRLPRRVLAFRPAELRLRSFSGPVEIDGAAPEPGSVLAEGTVIRTGRNGFVSFQAADGATVSLPSNSHARLERARIYRLGDLRDVEFRVLGGRGEVQVPVLREGERFRTGTPLAVTAVRGTEFRVGYDDQAGLSVTEVVEGTVSVANDTESRLASEGLGIATSPQGIGLAEALLPPAEIVDPGAIQTGDNVVFTVQPPMGAAAARTQVARDAGFLEIIGESISGEGALAFADLEDGRYFVRARGISQSGLEGLSQTYSFRRLRIGAEGAVDPSPIADGFRFAWLAQGDGPIQFALQLWRQGEAEVLLVDELAMPGSATVVTGLEPGTYVWRIAALQADAEDGLIKVWGPEQQLTVTE